MNVMKHAKEKKTDCKKKNIVVKSIYKKTQNNMELKNE